MRKTTIEIDEELFEQAREALGTKGLKETVHRAFEELIRARATEALIRRLTTMEGLDGPEVLEEYERKRLAKKNPWLEPLDT